jgi:hypothetical protein
MARGYGALIDLLARPSPDLGNVAQERVNLIALRSGQIC